ncbi:MAG: efflux RND transporter periplasmic adaptor subunit [Deltaproteobacteria bacterium]|nr:efflux RND transporter periplasmic adaptor subunit [Deltaproteobacteria bacterium]
MARKLVYVCLQGVLVVVFGVGGASCRQSSSAGAREHRALAVRTAVVRRGAIKKTIQYIGTVHSHDEIRVLARVPGRVAALPVKEGGTARRGAVVAVIAAPEMSARVSKVYAEVARAREESAFLCRLAKANRFLLDSQAISRIKEDGSRQKCASSKAALRAAKASLKEVRVVRGKTVERAPFDGKVLKWLAQPGENVMPGRPILIFGGEALEIRVLVNERDIEGGIARGTPVIVSSSDGTTVRAKVGEVSAMAVGPGRMLEVRIPWRKKHMRMLRHGMSVDVEFVLDEKADATSVPALALLKKDSKVGVFVVRHETAHWVPVTPSIHEGRWIAVVGKVSAGERVVVGNLEAVRTGQHVYPVAKGGMAQ